MREGTDNRQSDMNEEGIRETKVERNEGREGGTNILDESIERSCASYDSHPIRENVHNDAGNTKGCHWGSMSWCLVL